MTKSVKRAITVLVVLPIVCVLTIVVGMKIVSSPDRSTGAKSARDFGTQALVKDADTLFALHPPADSPQTVPESEWPAAIKVMKPTSVIIRKEGLYIKYGQVYAQDSGIFILAPASDFSPSATGDPAFTQVEGRLYYYVSPD